MPRNRVTDNQHLSTPPDAQDYHQVDIALSPSSSYEEISYRQAYATDPSSSTSSHSRHSQNTNPSSRSYPYLDSTTVDLKEEHLHLPLHHMESTEARQRRAHNIASPEVGGWTSSSPQYPAYNGYGDSTQASSVYPPFGMDDSKGVYQKERLGYATGRLPPRQSKTPVSLVRT